MAPTATSMAALAGGIAFCVVIATAALLIFRKAHACDLLGPVAVGGVLRLGVMVVVHLGSLHSGDGGLLFLDDWTYLHRGALLASPWAEGHIVDPAAYEYAGTYQFGFQALVASVFVLIRESIIAVKLVNVVLGTATVLLVGMLASRILGEAAKRRAGWLAALMPGLVWWSAPMMKEALATFLVVAALLAAASLPKRSAALWLCLLLAALVTVRTASALAVGTGMGAALAIAAIKRRGRIDWRRVALWTASVVLVIAALVLVVSKGTPGALIEQYRTVVENMIDAYRRSSLAGLPRDALKALVTPVPWTFDEATRNWDRGLYPGVWTLYIVYPLAAYGCWRMRRRPELALLAVPIVVTLVLNALSAGFVFRQRSTLEPFIVVLAIAGLVSWGQAALWAGLALVLVACTALVQSHSPLVFAGILSGAAGFLVAGLRLRKRTLPSAWPDSALEEALSGGAVGDRSALRNRATTTLFWLRLLALQPSSSIGEVVARTRGRAGEALRRAVRGDIELTHTSRLALTAAALLLLVFATLAVTTANERLAFERDVQRSFARTVETRGRTLLLSAIGSPTCRKTATYRFECTVPVRRRSSANGRFVQYRLRARDDGCWQAVRSTDQVHGLPQGMSGCASTSTLISDRTDRGTAHRSALANSSFEGRTLTPWQIGGEQHASFAVTRRSSWEGQRSARIRARGTRVRNSIVLGQLVPRAAGAARGSRYQLLVRVRTRGLNRRVQASIKLRYDDGNFDFFQGRAVAGTPGLARLGRGIPPGTSRRWITVRVDAVAKRRIGVMGVYAFDSGPGPLRGTVWIDSAELSVR